MAQVPASALAHLRMLLNHVHPLSDESWAEAESKFTYHHFTADNHIIESGEIISVLYFQLSGLARFYYLDPNGKEFNKSFSTQGHVLSSVVSLAAGLPVAFNVQAMEACECLALPYKETTELAERYKDWSQLKMRFLEQLAIKKEKREADLLLLSATDRYQNFLQEHADIADRIPNYHIASYLGITDVALSRIRNRMNLT